MNDQNNPLFDSVPRASKTLTTPKTHKKGWKTAKKVARFAKKHTNKILLTMTMILMTLAIYMLFTGSDVKAQKLAANSAKYEKYEAQIENIFARADAKVQKKQAKMQTRNAKNDAIRAWFEQKGVGVFQ